MPSGMTQHATATNVVSQSLLERCVERRLNIYRIAQPLQKQMTSGCRCNNSEVLRNSCFECRPAISVFGENREDRMICQRCEAACQVVVQSGMPQLWAF